ncbi:hypothetical protein EC973_004022 [Apophysomyces ossiformis]|uniref:Uncharacterized protein n=1 Tax=Apophysomyces ossiformis TaxID=679940 RepID=A0A8H7BX95_9FUNG|nr:hypothetical protein EC973_004022 [Apophysomyces ossiformis]
MDLYRRYMSDQINNSSLRSLHIFEYLVDILETVSFDSIPATLWAKADCSVSDSTTDLTDNTNELRSKFLDIARYALTGFHLTCLTPYSSAGNHERTCFVNYVIPSMMALSYVTGLVQMKWCETEFSSGKLIDLEKWDFDLRNIPNRFMDAIGKMPDHDMEVLLVEASSGIEKEDVQHTIEDTLKILDCSTSSLLLTASKYKNCDFELFKKLNIFCLHIIRDKITLLATRVHDGAQWEHVEVRSAIIPTMWSKRLLWIRVLELYATLMVQLTETKKILDNLRKQQLGILPVKGPTVEEHLHPV